MKKSFARLENHRNELAKRIVDRVIELGPDLISKTWVDTEMASGQFPAEIEARVPNPEKQVYGFELHGRTVQYAINTRKLKGNYDTINKLDDKMKFDCAIINPWYGKRQWLEAAEKARLVLKDDGMLVLVCPDATQAKSAWGEKFKKFLVDNGIQERWDVTDAFPTVNTGKIGVFFMDLKSKPNMSCLDANSIEATVLERMIALTNTVPAFSAVRGRQDIQYEAEQSDIKDQAHPVTAYISVTNNGLVTKYVSTDYNRSQKGFTSGKKILVNRYFGKNTPDPFYVIPDVTGHQLGYGVIAIDVPDTTNENDMMRLLTHPIYRKILTHLRGGGMDVKQSHLSHMPNFSLQGVMDLDKFLETQLSLTKEEKQYLYA
jgi:hypothetical protein